MEKRCGTVALIGAPNAGKSTLLNALLGEKLAPASNKPQTTRRVLRGVLTQEENQFIFLDTPGMLKPAYELQGYMQKQALAALDGVDVILFIVDAEKSLRGKDEKSLEVLQVIKRHVPSEQPVVLVLNKLDALKDRALLLPLMQEWKEKHPFQEIIPISALRTKGIEELTTAIAKFLPKSEFIFSEDVLTDASEKELVAEIVREKSMQHLGDEIPYQIAVTIDQFDETRRDDEKKQLVTIEAVIHVERESQKAIVIGKAGSRLKEIGMKSRKDMQTLLGCQVMLKLFVRVEPDWSKSPKALRKLGYR